MAVGLVAVTAACSTGATKSHGQATVKVSASPNGEASKTGPQVLADATNALATVPAVHISGSDNQDGFTVTIDARIQADGLEGSARAPGGTEQVLSVNGRVYIKGFQALQPSESSNLPKALQQQIDGRWLYIDPTDNGDSSDSVSFVDPTNLKGFAAALRKLDKGVTVEQAVTTDTLDGQPVVVVSESNGSKMFVAATGEPLPLKFIGKGNSDSDSSLGLVGTATLDYGVDPVKLVAPAGAVALQKAFESLLPSALSSLYPSGFPTDFPTDLPTDFPSAFASAFPSGLPSDLPSGLASQLKAFEQQHGGVVSGSPAPAPTP